MGKNMINKRTKSKAVILSGIMAISLLSPLAHAQIIFFDDFTEDYTAASTHGYQNGLSGTQNNLTYAPAGAPSNDLAWASNYAVSAGQYGSGVIPDVGYPSGTKATNGSSTEAYIVPAGGNAGNNTPVDVWTPIETGTGSAVNLVAGASYTISLDVGSRTDQIMSTLGIDLLTGGPIGSGNGDPNNGTVLDPSVTIGSHSYTDDVTLSQLTSGAFKNFTFTIPASALTSNSGALYLELVETGNSNQVNFSNIEITESAAWVGGTSGDVNDWNNANNWSVPAIYSNSNAFTPTIGAAAGVGSGVTNTGINLTQATTSGMLTFGATSQSFTVGSTSGYALTIDIDGSSSAASSAASTVALVNNGTSGTTQTISAALNVINSGTGTLAPIIDNAGNGSLTLSGGLSVDAQVSTATGATSGGFYLENDGTGTISVNGGAYYQASSSTTLNFTGAGAGVINFSPTSATDLGTINVATDSTVNFGTSFTATTVNLGNSTGVAGATAGAATVYLTGAGITLTSAIAESPSASGTLTFGSNDTAATSGSAVTNTLTGNWVTSTTAHTDVLSAAQYNTLDINGDISGGASTGTILVTGTGTVLLSQANTYAQKTTINGGTLEAAGTGSVTTAGSGSLNNTAGVTVNSGGTLLFGTSDQIYHSATVALSGGTLSVARTGSLNSTLGNAETMGALTLSARSTIDFGSGTSEDHNELIFSTFSAPGTVLTVSDWLAGSTYSQSSPSDTGSNDELLFGTGNGSYSLSTGQLAEIQFYVNGSEYQAIQFSYNGYDEVAPGTVVVPEPSTVFAAVCLLGLIGWRSRRRLQELVGGSTVTWQPSSFGYKGPHF